MESSRSCKKCSERALVTDHVTGNLVCSSCGVVQDYENYQAHLGGVSGPTGTYVRLGTAGTGSVYNYKETKIYTAQKVMEDIMFRLGLSGSRLNDVRAMIEKITEGEYGEGKWFPVFTGACAYVVMRKDNKTLPIAEVADCVGCDIYELGRMVSRVVDFLELKLPEFDIVNSLEKAIKTCPSFSGVAEDMIRRMSKQGVFLVQCLMKWFLTTGRRPMPIVAAVLVFVAAVNQVDVKIDDLAKELYAAVNTCKKRYKELLERLVEVAQALPWGKDVTTKNILKNAPSVIQYMELKSMAKRGEKRKTLENRKFDLNGLMDQCLGKELRCGYACSGVENDSQYFQAEHSSNSIIQVPDQLQFSRESLDILYSKVSDEASIVKTTFEGGENERMERGRGLDVLACTEWWKGKSELSKKSMLKKILEIDVGLNPTPPSFDKGCLAYETRREKIKAAKLRIQRTMMKSGGDSEVSDRSLSESVSGGKRKRKMQVDIDWEDLIIETLLLHHVKEDEIEKGHHSRLLDLHVFND